MGRNLTRKILEEHLVEGDLIPGEEIGVKIDHTLLQDATGTMAMLEFEALGEEKVSVELAAQYVDHNLLQTDSRNADDHVYLQSAASRYGINFSRPGNGVSHQVHMERFGAPGKTMIGSDSHTPGAAGVSMLAIGAGGLDVALAMAGHPYYFPCPKVLGVRLTGALPPWCSAKDVILEMLRRYGVKGCQGMVIEYFGPGVASLSATDRETIGNMGTETGATSTLFPSDEKSRAYLSAQGRGSSWVELTPDPDADYDQREEIDLSSIEPLIACPSSPGNVVPVSEVEGTRVDQVIVGSSVNSSYRDLMVTARMMEGRSAATGVSFHINPGSRQVLENVVEQGGALQLLRAGAIINEPGCLGCIGMGQAPGTGQVSLRTFPRNFPGRSGTDGDRVYLCSPEVATAAALKGEITDPRRLGEEMQYPRITDPDPYSVDALSLIAAAPNGKTEVVRGPNIKPLPYLEPVGDDLEAEVAIKVGDNISTDGIMPAGNMVLPYRSNIEAISRFVFNRIDETFPERCMALGGACVVGGENYGQGSSREHAALAPRFLGVRVKIAKGFARIHKANLCNFGILPLTFADPSDYDEIESGDELSIQGLRGLLEKGAVEIPVVVGGREITTVLEVSERQRKFLLAGGALNHYNGRSA
jgi:aconitate hydratase